jgi:hypothetical protein
MVALPSGSSASFQKIGYVKEIIMDNDLSRRSFIKAAGIAGGVALAGKFLSASDADAAMLDDPILNGVSDIHMHCAPDVTARMLDEITMARTLKQFGYKSVMFKCHELPSHDRAYLVRIAVPDFEVFGGIALNATYGDKINPYAAEMAVKTVGDLCRCIWMPTHDSAYEHALEHNGAKGGLLVVENGKVLPEVIKVMEICAAADIIFATGHSAPEECVIMAQQAKAVGVKKFVVTHATQHPCKLSIDQAKQVIGAGGYLEQCLIGFFRGQDTLYPAGRNRPQTTMAEFAQFIKLNPAQCFISTDFGQVMNPHPVDGMRFFIKGLLKAGLSQSEIDMVTKKVPERLMNLA